MDVLGPVGTRSLDDPVRRDTLGRGSDAPGRSRRGLSGEKHPVGWWKEPRTTLRWFRPSWTTASSEAWTRPRNPTMPASPSVCCAIFDGLDETLTVARLGLPPELRRSLARTNMIESMNSVVR